jgi:GNAT superfamily N-acetyltransferase
VRIRLAVASDVPAVRGCAEAAYARYVAAIGRRPAPMETDFVAAIVAGQIHVAEVEGAVAGYLHIIPAGDELLLDAVAVLPGFAGKGIGKALIRFAEDEARRLGLGWVRLYTNAKMVENVAIYPHLGYVETGRRRDEGYDRVFFEKRIPRSDGAPY